MGVTFLRPTGPPPTPPEGISRTMIPTPDGQLELLSATPSSPAGEKSPILFLHGGFGSAAMWRDFMLFLSCAPHNVTCYALSLRGHGNSWYPSYLRMILFTGIDHLTNDLEAGIRFIENREKEKNSPEQLVIVAHSAGGGLAQYCLNNRDVKLKGLALMAAFPNFGGFPVYQNWLSLDPWCVLRMIWHFGHNKSPLSSTRLVKRVFFCDAMPEAKVKAFERLTAPYDTMRWPMCMMFRGYVNVQTVLRRLSGWGTSERLMVFGGSMDRIMTPNLMVQMADEYREGVRELVKEHKIEAKLEDGREDEADDEVTRESAGDGVRLCLVRGGGHHLQNDIPWKIGATKLAEFYKQL